MAAIKSVKITKGSSTKTVQVGSKAYDKYLSQGYTVSGGSSSAPKETPNQTVARAKAMLGSAYNPNTPAPSAAELDNIANQSFITPENKAAYEATKYSPEKQNALASSYNTSKGIGTTATPISTPTTGTQTTPAWATTPQSSNFQTERGVNEPPSSSVTSNADPYFQQLLSALQVTPEEQGVQNDQTEAEKELRNLQRGQEQTNKNLADQPIAKPFITGQQAAVEQQYGIDRGAVNDRMMTLQQKLANLQAQRQSAIDVSNAGIKYGQNLDDRQQQAYQNTLAQQQYANQQAQQQYSNTTSESRYKDSQTQQALDNAYRQAQANKPSGSNPEDKETAAFQSDASKYVEQLGSNKISWGTAFNALKAKYPQASNELIDQTLGKERYYTVQGNADTGRSI